MDLRCRGCGQCAMVALHEFHAPLITLFRGGEDLVRFHVEEAQTHGAMPHDAFEVTASPASAIVLLGVERDDGMSAFPWAVRVRIASEAYTVADGPYADKAVELAARGGQTGRGCIGIVKDADAGFDPTSFES